MSDNTEAPRLYEPQSLIEGSCIELSVTNANHLGRVLRKQAGDNVLLFNGDGLISNAKLEEVSRHSIKARIGIATAANTESPLHTHIGQALSRGERMDYAVQKSTEMGVNQITPLFSEYSMVKLPADRQPKRISHWQKIAINASEQSGRVCPPTIAPPLQLTDWIKHQDAELKLVLHHQGQPPLQHTAKIPSSVALLIGPEGGLSKHEVEQAISCGFQPLTLGNRIMRTETAPVAILSILNYIWGDLNKESK